MKKLCTDSHGTIQRPSPGLRWVCFSSPVRRCSLVSAEWAASASTTSRVTLRTLIFKPLVIARQRGWAGLLCGTALITFGLRRIPFKLLKGSSPGHQTCYHKPEKFSLAATATASPGRKLDRRRRLQLSGYARVIWAGAVVCVAGVAVLAMGQTAGQKAPPAGAPKTVA